jgi:rubrerythrin
MILHTTSEVITFTKELENDSARFYEGLAQRYRKDAETFLSFARENKKNMAQIERTYYEVITDAIEGCFAFDIDPGNYTFKISIANGLSYNEILNQAVQIEDKIIKFYLDAANQSRSLMADIPRVFAMVAIKRQERIAKLRLLIKNEIQVDKS